MILIATLLACTEVEPVGEHLGILNRGPTASCDEDGDGEEVTFEWIRPPVRIGEYIVETRTEMPLWAPTDEWTTSGEGVDEIVAVRCQPDDLVRVSWWGL